MPLLIGIFGNLKVWDFLPKISTAIENGLIPLLSWLVKPIFWTFCAHNVRLAEWVLSWAKALLSNWLSNLIVIIALAFALACNKKIAGSKMNKTDSAFFVGKISKSKCFQKVSIWVPLRRDKSFKHPPFRKLTDCCFRCYVSAFLIRQVGTKSVYASK